MEQRGDPVNEKGPRRTVRGSLLQIRIGFEPIPGRLLEVQTELLERRLRRLTGRPANVGSPEDAGCLPLAADPDGGPWRAGIH
jgi:hypothetical protein